MTDAAYEKVGHQFGPERGIHVHICYGCGLIGLSNDLTRHAIRLGCDFKYHPTWKALKSKLTQHNGG